MSIAENVEQVREEIEAACARAGRSADEVTLVAVSKRKPAEAVLAAMEAGVRHFGENRLGEGERKLPAVQEALAEAQGPMWHFVGHIQSRKTKDVLPLFPVVHSLDSLKLARKMARIAGEEGLTPDIFVQVNISGEEQKYGFDGRGWERRPEVRERLMREMEAILSLDALNVRGLMTMAPFGAPEDELRTVFSSLAALRETVASALDVAMPDLSMGMTDDYPIAIEEGATVVRVGRAIFGERD